MVRRDAEQMRVDELLHAAPSAVAKRRKHSA